MPKWRIRYDPSKLGDGLSRWLAGYRAIVGQLNRGVRYVALAHLWQIGLTDQQFRQLLKGTLSGAWSKSGAAKRCGLPNYKALEYARGLKRAGQSKTATILECKDCTKDLETAETIETGRAFKSHYVRVPMIYFIEKTPAELQRCRQEYRKLTNSNGPFPE
jgi:hypothetical protein